MTRILIADDDDSIRQLVDVFLSKETDYSVVAAFDGDEALRAYGAALREHQPFDLIILDCAMPIKSGTVVASRVRELGDAVPIVLMTAHPRSLVADDVTRYSIADVFEKPFSLDAFAARVRQLVN